MGRKSSDIWLASALVLTMAAGCATQPPKPAVRPPAPEEDLCAERLHDIAGQLLMFYVRHGQLPKELSQLGPDARKPICPVCNKPYIYNPDGLSIPNFSARAIVWDAEPCHSGFRWAIVMEPPVPGQPLKLDVIRLLKEPVAP